VITFRTLVIGGALVVLGGTLVMAGRSDQWRLFGEKFEQVKVGMSEAQVRDLLGEPTEQLGEGGAYPPPLEGVPTKVWYYAPNITPPNVNPRELLEPFWSVGFRNGRVLLLKTPDR
jgi:hypothetical protein